MFTINYKRNIVLFIINCEKSTQVENIQLFYLKQIKILNLTVIMLVLLILLFYKFCLKQIKGPNLSVTHKSRKSEFRTQ